MRYQRSILKLRALPICLLCLCSTSYAEEIEFTASPSICPAEGPNAQCEKSLILQWNTNPDNRYCLFMAEISAPIQCWDKPTAKEIVYRFPDKLTQSIDFDLIVVSIDGAQRKSVTVEVSKPKNKIQNFLENNGIARSVSRLRFRGL